VIELIKADTFTGDGGDPGQVAKAPNSEWIELFHPQMITGQGAINDPDFWQPGVFHSEMTVQIWFVGDACFDEDVVGGYTSQYEQFCCFARYDVFGDRREGEPWGADWTG
jgi:hypothetical protein